MLSFHISSVPEPQQGKSAPIQKGLIPQFQGDTVDLCGEGLGFGTPILQYRRDFYFPGTATLHHEANTLEQQWTKVFNFNLIERKQQKALTAITTFSWVLPRLHNWIYQMKTGRRLLKLIDLPYRLWFHGIDKNFAPQHFIPVQSRGKSQCHFLNTKNTSTINVELNFDTIVRNNLQFIYIANELSGQHFTHYYDSTGLHLEGNRIEPWAKIKGQWALFYAPKIDFGFRVEIPEQIDAFRGRELLEKPEIFWSGIILQLPRSTTQCRYQVRFGTLSQIQEDH
ncbi:MAG: hypothetical protein ACFFD8_01760 [Candidatus Thorarchaeota archaeon]